MILPTDSLLKYDYPVLVSKNTERKSPRSRPLKVSAQQMVESGPVPPPPKPKSPSADASKQQTEEILNAILPPRSLQARQARETGICPVRRELYSQCFDELIRQVTINCAERGLLLLQVRDEIRMTIAAYQTLYESSLESEKRDLERLLNEQKAKCEAIKRQEAEQREIEEKKHGEEVQFLKRTNQQLKAQLEGIITLRNKA
ncbi:Axonemal dynein light intermediate polypeptide 1 [Labeo rohita]|uniref:Axonemal dynein light intermediate polypeptide 1 n=1 Tax=Labeo rohita TaxID=84645 RepID=A0ABQ8LWU9_LABRO|nr:Axonemal dynein light intermediate polypeptide 1 [Labeo rohita]